MRLRDALDQTATGALRRIAAQHGLPADDASTRAELLERLVNRLGDAVYIDEQIGGLNDLERGVLLAARSSDGELRGQLVEHDTPGIAEGLVQRGLMFRVFSSAGPRRGEILSVPEEVLDQLPAPAPTEAPPALSEPPPAPERRASDPAFSLFALASTLERAGAHLEPEVRPWSAEPGGWEWQTRWTFLQHLAQVAGLLGPKPDGALGATAALSRALSDPPALAERLWRAYLDDRGWSELKQAGIESGDELADPVLLRRAIADAFERVPLDGWLELEALSAWIERTRRMFLREKLDARGLLALESLGWAELELPFIRACLLGPFYWLGVLSMSPDGRRIARRVPPRAPSEACTWDGDSGTLLLAPTRADLGLLLQAERYLVLQERGRPSRYHLVQQHVAAAVAGGGSLEDCRDVLSRLTRAALPTGVDERLRAWQDRFGALTLRPAVVVEARSPADLDAALEDDHVRRLVRQRVGPTVAEVAASEALELAAALRESGHLPRVDAALRLASEPRKAYAGLVDEMVLEYLLVALLAFRHARPERLAELEGAVSLLDRLERQFPPERLAALRRMAERLGGELGSNPPLAAPSRRSRRARASNAKLSATAARRGPGNRGP